MNSKTLQGAAMKGVKPDLHEVRGGKIKLGSVSATFGHEFRGVELDLGNESSQSQFVL